MTSLRQRMTEVMQIRNLSLNTQASYKQQVRQFARYFNKSPELLGREEIRAYQLYLTNERKLATSSILIAIAAAFSLQSDSQEGLGFRRHYPHAEKASSTASGPQSRGGPAVSQLRRQQ